MVFIYSIRDLLYCASAGEIKKNTKYRASTLYMVVNFQIREAGAGLWALLEEVVVTDEVEFESLTRMTR